MLSPQELVEKLVALIPPPYLHLSRYFGVLASHSKWRRRIVLHPEVKKGFFAAFGSKEAVRMTWSRLLARVFRVDVSRCLGCGKHGSATLLGVCQSSSTTDSASSSTADSGLDA